MKTVVQYMAVLWIVAGLMGCGVEQGGRPYQDLTYPELRDVALPAVQRVTLPNGMRLLLLEDHELPLVEMSCRMRVGSIYEPADKTGLAEIMGEVMRTGGTESRTGDDLDELLEMNAASVECGINLDSGYASASSLKEDVDLVLGVLADVLMHPAFPEDKLQLARMQYHSVIARRNDSAGDIASREFKKLIYGADSVYAREMEHATLDAITCEDLKTFHSRFYGPNRMILGVWGDFDSKEMVKKIADAFAGWTPVTQTLPEVKTVQYDYPSTVNLVEKTDINQSNIYLGHIGGRMDDPDYFALVVMNRILGGGFTGRLFKNVRARAGLAYSVFGRYSANYDYPGLMFVGCQTQSGSTVKAIRGMVHELEQMVTEKATPEELAIAKESYLNTFVFNFDTTEEVVSRLMTYDYYGYPEDFLQKTKQAVEQVSVDDVFRAAKKHLHPDEVQILVVGRSEDFDESLSALGPEVRALDITIPGPDS
ncbi:MAG: insulinase family protein [Phycisphaerae bacterium]|nr:insulinase family protein [Phycisphaerae bacterium]